MKTLKNLVVGLSLVLMTQGAFAQDTKIGILNAIQALFDSEAAGRIQAELEQEFSTDIERASTLQEQLSTLQEEFQQNEAIMSEDEIRRLNVSAQDINVQLQLIGERTQQGVQQKNQEFVQLMQPELAKAVTDVVAEGGYDLILNAESAPFFSPVLDITARVTAKLNENAQADSE